MTVRPHRTYLDLRHKRLHLDKDNQRRRNSQGSGRMQNHADWTMVGVGVHRVNVRHLDEGEQGQQGQAHQHHHIGCGAYTF